MTWRQLVITAAALLCLTALEYRVVDLIQQTVRPAEEQTVEGILSGHPRLLTYQSRLLGPGLVAAVQAVTNDSYSRAYGKVAGGLLLLANIVCFALFRRADPSAAWTFTLMNAGLFVAFQDRDWLQLWDFADAVIFMVFAWAVVTGARTRVFVALFVCELLNRETAIAIAAWIVLDSVTVTRRRVAVNWLQLLAGVTLIAGALWWLGFIRGRLFIEQSMPLGQGAVLFHKQLWTLRFNFEALSYVRARLDLFVLALVFVLTAGLVYRAWGALGDRAWKVAVLLGLIVAATFLFGIITELRVWIGLQPFWLWLIYIERNARLTRAPVSQTHAQPAR